MSMSRRTKSCSILYIDDTKTILFIALNVHTMLLRFIAYRYSFKDFHQRTPASERVSDVNGKGGDLRKH
jgi:hypothetical protein